MDTAEQMLAALAAFVFVSSLKATALITLVLLVQKGCNRFLSAGMRYWLWLPVVIGLVTPIGFDAELPFAWSGLDSDATNEDAVVDAPTALPTSLNAQGASAGVQTSTASSAPPLQRVTAMRESSSYSLRDISWLQLMPYLWLAGVAIMIMALGTSARRFALLLRRATAAPAHMQTLLGDCAAQAACRTPVRLLVSTETQTPLVAGLVKPVLLLPADIEELVTPVQLRHIFLHELMHLRYGDIGANWVLALLQALHWFNPALWLAFARLRQDRELSRDAATLAHLAPAAWPAYGHTLLQLNDTLQQARVPAFALGMLGRHSQLHQRILMLARPSQHSPSGRIVATLVFLPLAAFAFSQPVPATRAEATLPASVTPVIAAQPSVVPEPAEARAVSTSPASSPARALPAAIVASDSENVVKSPARQAPAADEPDAVAGETEVPQAVVAQAATQASSADNVFTAAPPTAVLAAVSAQVTPQPPADLPYADLAEIEKLTQAITAAQADSIGFIEKWENLGVECDARKDRFLGSLSASCQRTRTALRRGEIFNFAFECYKLTSLHEALFAQYREAGVQNPDVEATLLDNEKNLATFCSKDTYASEYPAFAETFGGNGATWGPIEPAMQPLPQLPQAGPSMTSPPTGDNGIPMSWQGAAAPVPQ